MPQLFQFCSQNTVSNDRRGHPKTVYCFDTDNNNSQLLRHQLYEADSELCPAEGGRGPQEDPLFCSQHDDMCRHVDYAFCPEISPNKCLFHGCLLPFSPLFLRCFVHIPPLVLTGFAGRLPTITLGDRNQFVSRRHTAPAGLGRHLSHLRRYQQWSYSKNTDLSRLTT